MVTKQDILKIAELAKLYVGPEELDGLTDELNKMIRFADEVATASAGETSFNTVNGLENVFREDVPRPCSGREEILKNAGSTEDGFFLVRRRR
jgi:aspartyl/glutamyl-tRNA(Asn/Gln) amidotransferase C subunit